LQRGHDAPGKPSGSFCCGRCTPALWRNLAAGGLDQQEARLAAGMRYLRTHRKGDGEWRRFPFAYTVFALTAIDDPGAVRELRYAAPSLERRVKRAPGDEPYAQRRHAVFTRALERI